VALGVTLLLSPGPAFSQCCGTACLDADGDGAADDSVQCNPLLPDGLATTAGCADITLACVGGDFLPSGGLLDGCGCLLGSCVDESLGTLSAAECTAQAAAACQSGGNATVVMTDDPACEVCGNGICAGGETDESCPDDCGCANHTCGRRSVFGQAPGGCLCDEDCLVIGNCCADFCDVCTTTQPGCE
jgi:hypothetical protein